MTSCRSRFSCARAASKSMTSMCSFSSAIWAALIGNPSSRSASASATQSRRQVENFVCPDQSSAIAREA